MIALLAAVPYVTAAVKYVARVFKGGRQPLPQDENKEAMEVMDHVQQLQTLKTKLQSASKTNPMILWIVGQIDTILILAAGQTPEAAKEIVRDAAKTVLIWIKYAVRWAESTPGDLDDAIVEEILQTAHALEA